MPDGQDHIDLPQPPPLLQPVDALEGGEIQGEGRLLVLLQDQAHLFAEVGYVAVVFLHQVLAAAQQVEHPRLLPEVPQGPVQAQPDAPCRLRHLHPLGRGQNSLDELELGRLSKVLVGGEDLFQFCGSVLFFNKAAEYVAETVGFLDLPLVLGVALGR